HTPEEKTEILSIQKTRKLSKNLTCQCDNRLYQIQLKSPGYALRGAAVTVCKTLAGEVLLLHKGRRLPYTCWEHGETPPPPAANPPR
ncbi:MAG: transposase, partial [Myxococcota bacterium]